MLPMLPFKVAVWMRNGSGHTQEHMHCCLLQKNGCGSTDNTKKRGTGKAKQTQKTKKHATGQSERHCVDGMSLAVVP